MQIFAEVKYLCKRLHITMTSDCNFWDIIAIVIALDILYNDFDIIITSLLQTSDKMINQIQSILQSKKAKNISK